MLGLESGRAVREKGQVQPDREEQEPGFLVQILQLDFQLQEEQLLTFQEQILLQEDPEQGRIGLSGSSGVMIQLLTSQTQILSQSVPEQEGIGSEGPSTQIPHQGLQTWKSQVAVIRPLESLTNR